MRLLRQNYNWYHIGVFLILLLTVFLRFYNFNDRWGLAYDQAHDAVIARYALEYYKIPLVGPFSSAGPFQTGGEWYWFIMLGIVSFPQSIQGPWIYLTTISIVFVYLLIRFGTEVIDKKFGLIVGLLAAVSFAQNSQSVNLTNQSPLAIVSLLALYSCYRFVQTRERIYAFFLCFFVSLGASIHLQGVPLLLLLLATVFFSGIPSRKNTVAMIVGLLLPSIPLLIFDLHNNFTNTQNMLTYYFFNDNKISYEALGRRWLTYLRDFWPTSWAVIIGGYYFVAIIIMVCTAIATFFLIVRRELRKEWYIIFLSLLGSIMLLRYVRTPLFDSYLVFLHPFILLVTALAIYVLMKKKFIGIPFLIIILLPSLFVSFRSIMTAESDTPRRAASWAQMLEKKYPGKAFAIYDHEYRSVTYSFPLVYYLQARGLLADDGVKIGFGSKPKVAVQDHPEIVENTSGFILRDLESSTAAQLEQDGWSFINPSEVYRATQEWIDK